MAKIEDNGSSLENSDTVTMVRKKMNATPLGQLLGAANMGTLWVIGVSGWMMYGKPAVDAINMIPVLVQKADGFESRLKSIDELLEKRTALFTDLSLKLKELEVNSLNKKDFDDYNRHLDREKRVKSWNDFEFQR